MMLKRIMYRYTWGWRASRNGRLHSHGNTWCLFHMVIHDVCTGLLFEAMAQKTTMYQTHLDQTKTMPFVTSINQPFDRSSHVLCQFLKESFCLFFCEGPHGFIFYVVSLNNILLVWGCQVGRSSIVLARSSSTIALEQATISSLPQLCWLVTARGATDRYLSNMDVPYLHLITDLFRMATKRWEM